MLKKMNISDPEMKKTAHLELSLLESLSHPNIVAYKDCFYEKDYMYLIMEFCEGGDMASLIKNRVGGRGFEEKQIVDWTTQMCKALQVRPSRH